MTMDFINQNAQGKLGKDPKELRAHCSRGLVPRRRLGQGNEAAEQQSS